MKSPVGLWVISGHVISFWAILVIRYVVVLRAMFGV